MDDLSTKVGAGGIAGVIGILAGWFGLKSRVNHVEKKISDMKEDFRFEVTCDKIHEAIDLRLKTMEGFHKETRNDIKEILKRLSK